MEITQILDLHLNTSDVNVNPKLKIYYKKLDIDLNTSDVNVNQLVLVLKQNIL